MADGFDALAVEHTEAVEGVQPSNDVPSQARSNTGFSAKYTSR
jgi:hypothetical protein